MSNRVLIVAYDPNGVVGVTPSEYQRRHGIKEARLPLADDLSEATIAGYATRLGLLLLEQLVPPLRLFPMSLPPDPSHAFGALYVTNSFAVSADNGFYDEDGQTQAETPLTADANGRFATIFLPGGTYDLKVFSGDGLKQLLAVKTALPTIGVR